MVFKLKHILRWNCLRLNARILHKHQCSHKDCVEFMLPDEFDKLQVVSQKPKLMRDSQHDEQVEMDTKTNRQKQIQDAVTSLSPKGHRKALWWTLVQDPI